MLIDCINEHVHIRNKIVYVIFTFVFFSLLQKEPLLLRWRTYLVSKKLLFRISYLRIKETKRIDKLSNPPQNTRNLISTLNTKFEKPARRAKFARAYSNNSKNNFSRRRETNCSRKEIKRGVRYYPPLPEKWWKKSRERERRKSGQARGAKLAIV